MKKKVALWISSVLLLAAYVALGMFAYAQDGETQPAEVLPLNGAWRVVSFTSGNNASLIPCEFMTFTDDTVADYRNDMEKPIVNAAYTYQDGVLSIESIGRSYVVDRKAEHVMLLNASPTEYMELAYYGELDNYNYAFAKADLDGSWNITYRRGIEQVGKEVLVFDAGTMRDYRNDSTEPALTAAYEWDENGNLVVSRLAKIYMLYPVSANEIYFVETDTGYVWDLTRAE